MDALRAQVTAVTDELSALKQEIVQIKSAHAQLHQSSVDANGQQRALISDQMAKLTEVEKRIDGVTQSAGSLSGAKSKDLIEPKQINVPMFAGSAADNRAKFMAWGEKVKDKVGLFSDDLGSAMEKAEKFNEPITEEESTRLGIHIGLSRQLHGYLKDRTEGTALALVRSNKSKVGLESWRQ